MGGEGHSAVGRPPRMKNLGILNSSQACDKFISDHKIDTGEFVDIEIGDYVTITHSAMSTQSATGGMVGNATSSVWYIAGLDWKYARGYGAMKNWTYVHNITLFPQKVLFNASIYESTADKNKGYGNSYMITVLNNIGSILDETLGNHLLINNQYCSSAVSSSGDSMIGAGATGYAHGKINKQSKVCLLTEIELRGCSAISSSWYDNYSSMGILPLFNISPWPNWINDPVNDSVTHSMFLIRSLTGYGKYALAHPDGYIYEVSVENYNGGVSAQGVRPYISIG